MKTSKMAVIKVVFAFCVVVLGLNLGCASNHRPWGGRFRAGDRLVLVANNYRQEVEVNSDGTIDLSFLGKVHVAGLTPEEAADAIRAAVLKGTPPLFPLKLDVLPCKGK